MLGSHSRVVSFQKDERTEKESLKEAIETSFLDVFETPPAPFFFDENYVDIKPEHTIPDKSFIQVVIETESVNKLICKVSYIRTLLFAIKIKKGCHCYTTN